MTRPHGRFFSKWPIVISSIILIIFLYRTLVQPISQPTSNPSLEALGHHVFLTKPQLLALRPPPFNDNDNDNEDNNNTFNKTLTSSNNRRLRVFMPADSPNLSLCKTIMSSVALGYPLPILLNWDGDFNRPEWHFAGSHIAKLESLLSVIEALLSSQDDDNDNDQENSAHEDDLALMVDAYDLWFQLPPSVLIQRFHQLNHEANLRNAQSWSPDFPIPPPRQNIIVTSAKDCFPLADSGSDPHYDLWPESPMPSDLYGEGTDQLTPPLWDSARKYRRVRPRCVNSGMIMGTMGALRDALRRCRDKVDAVARQGRQIWSDQALFGEVIGDQEAWRMWVRGVAGSWNGTVADGTAGGWDEEEKKGETGKGGQHVRSVAEEAMRTGKRFEFGIGLDYNFTTIPATCSAEEDGYFVQVEDKEALAQQSERAGVPGGQVRVKGVPEDLARGSGVKGDAFTDVSWGQESLYTDFFFGVTPVGIHHNAYVEGLKPWRIKNWWSRMWFHDRLRELVVRSLREGAEGVRVLLRMDGGEEEEGEVVYKAPRGQDVTVFKPGVDGREKRPASFYKIGWDGVCQKGGEPWYEGLFGDGKGPLEV